MQEPDAVFYAAARFLPGKSTRRAHFARSWARLFPRLLINRAARLCIRRATVVCQRPALEALRRL
jgi:hypothetical protein